MGNISEIDRILKNVRTFHNRVFLTTVYSCGLRLQEAIYLQVSDIDSQRMMIHVHRGKQTKDRYVPLPEETLFLLRKYWATHRNQLLIFLALGRSGKQASTAKSPMAIDSVQGALRKARYEAGIKKL
ncbi:MAG: tyrosine-type recombinase/integrase [Desulfobacterales bacterium]